VSNRWRADKEKGAPYEAISHKVSFEKRFGRTVASGHRSIYLGAGQRSRLAAKNIVSVRAAGGEVEVLALEIVAETA
jgi:hypothetical protein